MAVGKRKEIFVASRTPNRSPKGERARTRGNPAKDKKKTKWGEKTFSWEGDERKFFGSWGTKMAAVGKKCKFPSFRL